MSAILSKMQTSDCAPAIILVGTHGDRISAEDAEKIMQSMKNNVKDVFGNILADSICLSCAVDNDPGVQSLIHCLEEEGKQVDTKREI